MKKKILIIIVNIVVIIWLSLLYRSDVSATIGNTESFVYSNDYFSGDYYHVLELEQYFSSKNQGKI